MSMYRRQTDYDDLIFRVDRWDKAGVRLDCCLAACSNLLIGRGGPAQGFTETFQS